MSEVGYCFVSTMACKGELCDLYHEATGQCKIVMVVNRILGDIDGPVKKEPELDPQSTEGVIQRILTTYPNLTKEAVERLIDDERAKAAGLLTEQAAAHLVASNLGQRSQSPLVSDAMKTPQRFPDFKEGNYETLTGTIMDPAEAREVNTRGGTKMVANVFLTDGETKVRIGLWGDLVDEIATYGKGDVVTINNLSVKAPYDGVVQLSSTKNTKISR